MWGMVGAQMRFRLGRSAALVVALLVAVTSFTTLTATARSQRLQVVGKVTAADRGSYDLLVRPAGARSALETQDNLISPTALSSLSGGITEAQWRDVLSIPGVAAAAPVAVVGYALPSVNLPVDLSEDLAPGASDQVLKVAATQVSERGLTRVPAGTSYLYATSSPLRADPNPKSQVPVRVGSDGRTHQVCAPGTGTTVLDCTSTSPDNTFNAPGPADPAATGKDLPAGSTSVSWSFPYLVEAVDPVQEAKLVGLDSAVTKGSYFAADQGPVSRTGTAEQMLGVGGYLADAPAKWTEVPVLMADRTPIDESLRLAVSRLPATAAKAVASGAADADALSTSYGTAPGAPVTTTTVSAASAYRTLLQGMEQVTAGKPSSGRLPTAFADLGDYLTAAAPHYALHGSTLSVAAQPGGNPYPDSAGDAPSPAPGDLRDTAVRKATDHAATQRQSAETTGDAQLRVVGEFDPSKLSAADSGDGLGAVPMETYFPARADGGDAASVKALGGKSLLPNGNVRGLLSVPPSMITTLSSLPVLQSATRYEGMTPALGVDAAAPISVLRVKLTGALGIDKLSRARLQLVAQQIHRRTGLDVDVTEGSSPVKVHVADPVGKFGRPPLLLDEWWPHKGVAAVVVSAVDRKSLVLFVLVLVVCALFVSGATAAAVRGRRGELAVLACVGWPARRLFGLVLAEVLALSLVAGVAGTLLALPVSSLVNVRLSFAHALLAVPAAVALAGLAALRPARQASRAHPAHALAPLVRAPRRPPRRRSGAGPGGVGRLALVNLRRAPGRALLGAAALAVGVAALVALAGISAAFHGAVSGSLLGDAVIVQVRGSDYTAAVIAALLGIATIVDVLYVNLRDRAAEHALLHAVGWTDRRLSRLVLTEAGVMGLVGAVVGAGGALAGVRAFTGGFGSQPVLVAAGVALAALAVTLAAAAVPAWALRRGPAAELLAEE